MTSIKLLNAEGSYGIITADDGVEHHGPIPPNGAAALTLYNAAMAAGVKPQPYVAPAKPARSLTGYELVAAMTKEQAVAFETAPTMKATDRLRMLAKGGDRVPVTNAVVGRVAVAIGTTPDKWFDAAEAAAVV